MSDTPRVDSYVYKFPGCQREPRLIDFARKLERELADAQAEVERLALEIENQQYTITCASEENQQLKESLAEARAELDRLKRSWDSWALKMWLNIGEKESDYPCTTKAIARLEKDMERKGKLIGQMRDALKALKQRHYVNDDDNWYSCPASELCGNDHAGTDCNCGADYVNSIIEAALSAAERVDK